MHIRMYSTQCYLSISMSWVRNASAELGRVYVLPDPSVLAVGPLPWPRSSPRCLLSQCWWCSGRRQGDSTAESRRWRTACKNKGSCVTDGCLSFAKEGWKRAAPHAGNHHRDPIWAWRRAGGIEVLQPVLSMGRKSLGLVSSSRKNFFFLECF